MTLVIAFDTATEVLAIGLGRVHEDFADVIASRDEAAPRAAMSRLLPSLREMLEVSGVSISEIGAVVVGRGPGSFTGVRIGVATAKGLARGLGVPLYGVGTQDAVARRLEGHAGLVGVLGDAMRGEVYPALFRCGGGRCERLSEDRVCAPEEAAREWAASGEPVLLTGNGLVKHGAVFAEVMGGAAVIADTDLRTPTGASLLAVHAAAGPWGEGDPAILLPVYTRLSDAEEAERARGSAACAAVPRPGVAGPPEASS